MSTSEDSDAIAALASEIVAPIGEELRGRLTRALEDRDALAAESALLKAFLAGMQAGVAETAESESAMEQLDPSLSRFSEQPLLPAELSLALPQLDPWAERYGGG